jgi:hypothetical protein
MMMSESAIGVAHRPRGGPRKRDFDEEGELSPQQPREGQWFRLELMRMDACFCTAVRRAPECPICEE